MESSAASGTTFAPLPARARVAVSVVPWAGAASVSRNDTKRVSSTSAEAPFSGSRPACAARPRKRTWNKPQPLRATLAAPSRDGSSTSTRRWRRATRSVSSREACEPSSSSGTSSSDTGNASGSRAIAASTAIPTAIPAFMSKTPGPHARPASRCHGSSSRVPVGQTVSRCPSSSVPFSRSASAASTASPRGGHAKSSAGTPRSRSRSWTQAASCETRAASSLGLSMHTSASRSETMRDRSDSNAVRQRVDTRGNLTVPGGRMPPTHASRRSSRRLLPQGLAFTLVALAFAPCATADEARPGIFRITPLRPVAELRELALQQSPPAEPGPFRPVELVELTALDPTIRLDIRYATPDNFLSAPVYTEARAFLQRKAAEALVRAHRALAANGFGLLIHDAYRPWWVTKLFWDATPSDKRAFVAAPAKGSR